MIRPSALLAALAALGLAACGKYGPPQRSLPIAPAAAGGGAEAPPQAAPPDPDSSTPAGGAARSEAKPTGDPTTGSEARASGDQKEEE